MLMVSTQGLKSGSILWSDGAIGLEAVICEWFENIEPMLVSGVKCNLSLWSNDYYLLSAVASFAADGNSEGELVIEVGFHRNNPDDKKVHFSAEVCRESGPPLAGMTPRAISLESTAALKVQLEAATADFQSFLIAQSPLVVEQLSAIARNS